MTDEITTIQPSEKLKKLDRLVGTWKITGGATGTTTYEWLDGGFFLMQRTQFDHDGHTINGLEMIGHLQPFGAEPSEDIHSRYYGGMGETFDYVYEIEGDTLMIWGGEKGSPAYFKGTFSADGNKLTGGWTYPDGGGYQTVSTRVA